MPLGMGVSVPVKEIETGKVKNQKGYIYIMHENSPRGIPSQHYVDICMEGYLYFGFDTEILKKAIEKSKK